MDESMIFSLFISILVPLCAMMFLFDRKTRKSFLFIIVGTYVCVICGCVNGYIMTRTGADIFYLATTVTPVVEEFMKALPIFFYALFITDGKKRVLSASAAVGLGFALLENIYVRTGLGSAPALSWTLSRCFGAGLMHCGCSVIVGYGMIMVRGSRRFFVPNLFAMFTTAVIYHGVFNALSGTGVYGLGPVLSLLVFGGLILFYFRNRSKEERESGGESETTEKNFSLTKPKGKD